MLPLRRRPTGSTVSVALKGKHHTDLADTFPLRPSYLKRFRQGESTSGRMTAVTDHSKTTMDRDGTSSLSRSPSSTSIQDRKGMSFFCFSRSNRKKSFDFLVSKRRWSALTVRLKNLETGEHESLMNLNSSGETILSLTCRFNPPHHIIQLITQIFPRAAETVNANEQYPIHMAASYGASPAVISHLCDLFPEAAGRIDNLGRTPLHLACSDYVKTYKICRQPQSPLLLLDDAIYQTVRELINASPQAVHREDYDGTSALEYGISANVDIKAINCIQKACERFYKSQSERQRIMDPFPSSVSFTSNHSTTSTHVTHCSSSTTGRVVKEKQTSMTNNSVETAISSDGQLNSPMNNKEDELDPSSEYSDTAPNIPKRISLEEMRRLLEQQEEELQL